MHELHSINFIFLNYLCHFNATFNYRCTEPRIWAHFPPFSPTIPSPPPPLARAPPYGCPRRPSHLPPPSAAPPTCRSLHSPLYLATSASVRPSVCSVVKVADLASSSSVLRGNLPLSRCMILSPLYSVRSSRHAMLADSLEMWIYCAVRTSDYV